MRLRIAWATLLGLVAVAAGTARLVLLGYLLGRVLSGDPLASLARPIALVALATALRGVLEYARAMVAHHTAARVQARLRERLYGHVTALGPAHFTRVRTGDVTVSLVEGVQQLEVYFGQYLPQLFVAALTPFLIFAVVLWIDLPVAAVLLVAALLALALPAAWHRAESASSLARSRAYAAYAAEFLDSVQGVVTLAAFGQGRARARALDEKGRALFERTMWVLGTNTLARGITDTVIALGAAAALALGAWRVERGAMDLAALVMVLMLGVEVFRPVRELRVVLHQGMLGLSAAKGILGLLGATPTVRAPDRPDRAAEPLAPTVELDAVTFRYPGGRVPVHRGLSFRVAAGERVAVVGGSGAGKSTIARLLLRFADPEEGRVLVGGRDARDCTFDQLRSRIAVVSQDTYLFHGTVEDNLRLGRPEATQGELEAAARAARIHDFVAGLPDGYHTVVGERGLRLSGGQRQRIAIARALLRDAPILVLDEALSSVDADNEAAIQEALDRLMVGRTTLIFAHRLSSVIGADRILVLDGGRVVESGVHAELMARGGVYHRLMAGQATDDGAPGDLLIGAAPAGGPAADGAAGEAPPADAPGMSAGLGWLGALRLLAGMAVGYRARLVTTFALGVARVAALIGVGAVGALVVRAVVDGTATGSLLALLFVIAPLAGILHWVESWLAHDMAYRLLADMRMRLFEKLVALGPAYALRRRTGDLLGVATHDVELIEYFFAHTITPAAVAVLVPAAVLGVLVAAGWPLALAVLPFLVYAAASPVIARARIDRLSARARAASGELNAHAVDSVQGLGEIVAFQSERRRGEALATRARAYAEARMPFLSDLARQGALQEVATALGGLAVTVTGAWLVSRGQLDSGLLPLLTLLAMSAFVPVWEIAQVGRQLADTLAATRRVQAIHAAPITVADGPGIPGAAALLAGTSGLPAGADNGGAREGRPAPPPADRARPARVELARVRFGYPGRPRPALEDVSFSVPDGATVALVGPSGAGKTTVASLLLRFWDPDAGAIRLDGHDLRAYRLDELRRAVALVAQDTHLFNDTLRANLLVARPEATPAAVAAAVEGAALAGFVDALPDGLDTPVGERGLQLSGGQRQRVAIARAFLKDAPVLILDEATSHLDALSEETVQRALDRLARDRTTLVIAHRLSTVRAADRIVVLDEGRVVESGPHATLLARGGLYARLISRQLSVAAGGR